jgi:predicted acylesterase/phospholipase RssA
LQLTAAGEEPYRLANAAREDSRLEAPPGVMKPSPVRTRGRRATAHGALAMAGLVSLVACAKRVDTRSILAMEVYPQSAGPIPRPTEEELDLQVFASLELEAVMAYRDPGKMAACLRAVADDPAYVRDRGYALAAAGAHWGSVAREMALKDACADAGDAPALVRFVLARIATAATSMAVTSTMDEPDRWERVYKRVPTALRAIANILANTSPRPSGIEDAPVLALGGGAANGAFSAGFVFELLALRERALVRDVDPRKYQLSAVVGTSAGALIAQLVDLYFVEHDPTAPTQAQASLIASCERYWDPKSRSRTCPADVDVATSSRTDCFDGFPPPTEGVEADGALSGLDAKTRDDLFARRPRQMCALTKLYQSFTDDDEQTLMCVEPGPVTRIVGLLGIPDQNFMRFDPLSSNVLTPVLDAFSEAMIDNDVPRVVVSVEAEDSQILGLDERVCRPLRAGAPRGREYCLGSAVVASSVLPIFARGVRHTYDGVTPMGFCGAWFDGGLRSEFPTYRALRMARPAVEGVVADPKRSALRVLAVGTGPLEGLPQSRPSSTLDVLLNIVGQMSAQNEVEEVLSAQQMAIVRENELLDILGKPHAPSETTVNDDTSVSTVYVPTETPPYLVEGAEYSFDRTLMRGLWVWGRHVAIERVLGRSVYPKTRGLFERLGWTDLEPSAVTFARADEQTLKPWFDAYRVQAECPEHQTARADAGRNRIATCVPSCSPIAAGGRDFPLYFACPDGAGHPHVESRHRAGPRHP